MNKLSIATMSVAALLATSAMAQQMPSDSKAPVQAPSPSATAPATSAAAPAAKDASQFVDHRLTGQRLSSEVIGMTVRGPDDESIGEIDDMVLDSDGKVIAAVVGVGGFLGVGEKDVAVPYETVEFVGSGKDIHAQIDRTKDDLKAAPEFDGSSPTITGSISPAAK